MHSSMHARPSLNIGLGRMNNTRILACLTAVADVQCAAKAPRKADYDQFSRFKFKECSDKELHKR